MKGLLVRVGADQSEWGGWWNGPVDSRTGEFVYVPIPDEGPFHPGLATPYSRVASHLGGKWPSMPSHLTGGDMHLDPDFEYLTYGDQGERAKQINSKVGPGDFLVFYAGLRDIHSSPQLVYAIIGLFVIEGIIPTTAVPRSQYFENAHTRRSVPYSAGEIVVRAHSGMSGRLGRCLPIGNYRDRAYRVLPHLLTAWGGLTVKNGYVQRSARLPEFSHADKFYDWFDAQKVELLSRNN
jgi:hypothetical protein